MGQSNARHRLEVIRENVDEITEKIKSDQLSTVDRDRSHDILLNYIKELKFILSKSLRTSNIRKVEKLIIAALQELATLESERKNVEPRLKAKSLQTLHDIEKDMKTLSANLSNPNLETEKETINNYKKRISLIDDVDQEVGVTKNKVLDVVSSVENTFTELEVEDELKQAEDRHYRNKLDLGRFVGVSESNCYKKHKQHLLNLKEEINRVSGVSTRISERKNYLLFNIDNNLAALDKKVKENEDNIKQKIVEEDIFRATTPIIERNSIKDVISSYAEFERSFSADCSLDELQEIFKQLHELKIKIDQKLKVLENQIEFQDIDSYIQFEPVKENDGEMRDSVEIPVASPRVLNKIKDVQKCVEDLSQQISISRYTKEGLTYKHWKRKLEDHKREMENVSIGNEEEKDYFESVSQYIDEVLVLLENNSTDRRSTTGDLLIDIMSISTSVNELGNNIKSVNIKQEYSGIEDDLLEHLYYLRRLEIPASRSNVCKFRDYVLIQIDSHLSHLEKLKKNLHQTENSEQKSEKTSTSVICTI